MEVYSIFLPSSFCLLAARSVASIVVILMLATIPCNTEIKVFTRATGADTIASNLNNDIPRTTNRIKCYYNNIRYF